MMDDATTASAAAAAAAEIIYQILKIQNTIHFFLLKK